MLPRLRRLPLVLAVSALIGAQPMLPALAQTQDQTQQPAPARAGTGLSVEQARAAATRILETLQRGDKPQAFLGELEYLCKDGSTVLCDVQTLPHLSADGELIALYGVSRRRDA